MAQQGATATASFVIRSAPCVVSVRSYMSRATGDVAIDAASQTFTATGPASLNVRLQCGTDNQVDVYLTTVESASTDLLAVAEECTAAAQVVPPAPPPTTTTATSNAPLATAQGTAPAAVTVAAMPVTSVETVTVTQPITTTLPGTTTTVTRTLSPALRCPAGTERKEGYCLKTVVRVKRVVQAAKPHRARPAKPAVPQKPSKSSSTPKGRGVAPVPYTLTTRKRG